MACPPDEVHTSNAFSIPLKVASMGLSLTMLLLIAVVTFSLATVAGQQSTDEAIDNGRTALALSHTNSVGSTIHLSNAITDRTISSLLDMLHKEVLHREYRLKMVEDMLADFDGSWQQFDVMFLVLVRLMISSDQEIDAVRMNIFTTRGFFIGTSTSLYKTDDRPDEMRRDGVVGTVAETQEGWRYGVNKYDPDYVSRGAMYRYTRPTYEVNMSRILAGNIGDPLAVTRGQPATHTTWMAGKLSFPGVGLIPQMSAFRPLVSLSGEHLGTVEIYSGLPTLLADALGSATRTGNLQNMTVLVIDQTDKAILGSVGVSSLRTRGIADLTSIQTLEGVFHMHNHPEVRITSLASYLDENDGWTNHAGVFNQRDNFKEQPYLTLVNVTASGGKAVNVGYHMSGIEMRDGACGACVVFDAQLQKEVLVFDGATTLYLYRNMTRDTPLVAQSRVSGPGEPWRSRYESFNETLAYPDGTECVARTYHLSLTTNRTRCLLVPDVSRENSYTVSMRIRPDELYTETAPSATTPRLFSDSLVGDANIRLFANGQLYLLILQYGCRTKAVQGGFPVGMWTTITASVGEGSCHVYVNGTLHDSSHDARHSVRKHGDPYRSGQFFKGRMDSVLVIERHLNESEVVSLHRDDRLLRDVESKDFFTQTKTLDMRDPGKRDGVEWGVIALIPRDDIMREVDARRREMLQDVQVYEDNTKKKLAQRANATIMVIVAIAMTSVLVFLVFNNMLTQPVSKFAGEILRVSQVDIDGIATAEEGGSFLSEINVMQCAMNTLVKNMREYKTFMPEAIFANEPSHADFHTEAAEAPGLETGYAAVLFTDVQGSTRLWEACTEAMAEALRLHNTLIREVIAECGGYEVKTIGDAFMVAFKDLDTAVRFGLRTQERLFQATWPAGLLEVVQAPGDEGRGLRGMRVRMGLTHGVVAAEQNAVVRRCDYFGPTVNRAARLEANGVCGGVVVEEAVVSRIAAVQQQQAMVVPLGKRSLKGIGDIPLSLLVPASMPQRAAHALVTDQGRNPLQRHSSTGSLGSCSSGSDTTRKSQRAKLRAVERFSNKLSEVGSATTGCLDCEVDGMTADMTVFADSYLLRVVTCLGRSDGRLLNVCGTSVLVAWNVMAPCAGHLEAALRFASLIVGRGDGLHCGLSSSKVFSGYVGTGNQRFVTAVGQGVQVSQLLHAMAVQKDEAVLYATQDTHVTSAMQTRGFAEAAGELHKRGAVYSVCSVLHAAVASRLETKQGLFSTM